MNDAYRQWRIMGGWNHRAETPFKNRPVPVATLPRIPEMAKALQTWAQAHNVAEAEETNAPIFNWLTLGLDYHTKGLQHPRLNSMYSADMARMIAQNTVGTSKKNTDAQKRSNVAGVLKKHNDTAIIGVKTALNGSDPWDLTHECRSLYELPDTKKGLLLNIEHVVPRSKITTAAGRDPALNILYNEDINDDPHNWLIASAQLNAAREDMPLLLWTQGAGYTPKLPCPVYFNVSGNTIRPTDRLGVQRGERVAFWTYHNCHPRLARKLLYTHMTQPGIDVDPIYSVYFSHICNTVLNSPPTAAEIALDAHLRIIIDPEHMRGNPFISESRPEHFSTDIAKGFIQGLRDKSSPAAVYTYTKSTRPENVREKNMLLDMTTLTPTNPAHHILNPHSDVMPLIAAVFGQIIDNIAENTVTVKPATPATLKELTTLTAMSHRGLTITEKGVPVQIAVLVESARQRELTRHPKTAGTRTIADIAVFRIAKKKK